MEPPQLTPQQLETERLIVNAVEDILSKHGDCEVRVDDVASISEDGRRNILLRLGLSHNKNKSLPKSLIVKKVVTRNGPTYDPDNVKEFDTVRFFGDWAGAELLTQLEFAGAPRFYGGHRALGLILLEDVGKNHKTMVNPMLEGKQEDAEEALLKYAAQLGHMAAATLGKVQEFQKLQKQLHPELCKETKALDGRRFDLAKSVGQINSILNTEITKEAEDEIQKVIKEVVHNPGPFTAYIHNDSCPDNFILQENGELRILDFEFGRMGHALNDIIYARMLWPSCWCCNALPKELVVKMEATFRDKLGQTCPDVLDDAKFYEELTKCCGCMLLETVKQMARALTKDEDLEWGIAATRPRIVTRVDAFVDVVDEFGHLPALRDVAKKLLAHLKEKWPDTEQLPLYPAFR